MNGWLSDVKEYMTICLQVCRDWQFAANDNRLWREHCYLLGLVNGVPDLPNDIEEKHAVDFHDWKALYHDLEKKYKKQQQGSMFESLLIIISALKDLGKQ